MKKIVFILAVITMVAFASADVGAIGSRVADTSPATLTSSQRDINIAVFAFIVGSVLVGYEKAARKRHAIRARKHSGAGK